MLLGAGRETDTATIDHAVGVLIRAHVGTRVTPGTPILEVHYNDTKRLSEAHALLQAAIRIDDIAPASTPLVWDELA